LEDLKVVLAVPQYEVKVDTGNLWLDGVGEFASRHDADLVVFPEAFIARYFGAGPLKRGKSILRDLARKYNRATLAGFTTDEGYETALYYNPHATSGETREHLQYKHVIADRVAFVHPRWKDKVEEWFSPIHLKGYRIGVCICYEMFLSPVIQALENRGAQMYIDLTGDNVQPHKWKAIVGGRSIEAQAPFLCTMGYFATWTRYGIDPGRWFE
jgi:predicted amidohydrolase